jgi:hypothetical protein
MRDNEEWVESMRRENDEKRKEIAEETVMHLIIIAC